MTEWQDISTAPDDDFVLVTWLVPHQPYRVAEAFLLNGAWFNTDNKPIRALPTHWTHRPAPPTAYSGGSE